MNLQGHVALVTGASQGLGKEIARAFRAAGASVAMVARDPDRLWHAAVDIAGEDPDPAHRLLALPCDVTDEAAVSEVVARTSAVFGHLDILVNNAGIYGPKGPIEQVNLDEWRRALDINLLGTLIPIRQVVGSMKERRCGKIINLSGGGATNPMPFITAYAASKAAVVRLTESLALELHDFHVDVNAVAPGALNTRLLEEILQAGPDQVGTAFYQKSLEQKAKGGASLVNAAELCVFLASSASNGVTGRLISAVWDNWASLPERAEELRLTDIYTLRRITSADRGRTWDK
jgi:NAD(P)-dependent dehydrogenase (short-subunit alcohol dehydrogenase family)